jgi:hypothetical protein
MVSRGGRGGRGGGRRRREHKKVLKIFGKFKSFLKHLPLKLLKAYFFEKQKKIKRSRSLFCDLRDSCPLCVPCEKQTVL